MRRRRSVPGLALFGAVVAAGCAGQPSYLALPPPSEPGPIAGTVVDGDGRPMPGMLVATGGEKTRTDGNGRFSFPMMPANYDLAIAGPDATYATVYQGLGRRDPSLEHHGPRAQPRVPAHSAKIIVTLSGDQAGQSSSSWQVHFASPQASAVFRGRPAADTPLAIGWDGADTITGLVLALPVKVTAADLPIAFAQQPLTVRDGETATIALPLATVGVVRRTRPKAIAPKEEPGIDFPHTTEDYRVPGVGSVFRGPGAVGASYDTPDLRAFGLLFCTDSFLSNPYVRTRREQCDVDASRQVSVQLPSPPAFTAPAWDTLAAPGLQFTWSAVPTSVYRLLLTDQSHKRSAEHPTIEIFTTRTTASWPDLGTVGVGFPAPLASYAAIVGTRGPYASIDVLAGPQGIGERTPRDRWSADSQELSVPVRPPLGKEEAACTFPGTVFCGPPGAPASELYRLSVINRKIQNHPEFAAATNIHCVRDCAGARAYLAAQRDYSAAHPDFDHDPLPVDEPPPAPPKEMIEEMQRRRRRD